MAKRGKLYRCHVCSFLFGSSGPQTDGVDSDWTKHLAPIGDREVYNGELVELSVQMEGAAHPLSESSKIRFDILEEDLITSQDDYQLSLCGPGALLEDPKFPRADRLLQFAAIVEPDTVGETVRQFKALHPDDFNDYILAIKRIGPEATTNHIITWWTAEYTDDPGNDEYYFIVNIDDQFDDQSNTKLDVTSRPAPARPTDPANQAPRSATVSELPRSGTEAVAPPTPASTRTEPPAPRLITRRISEDPVSISRVSAQPSSLIPDDVQTTPAWYWTDRPNGPVANDRIEQNARNLLKGRLTLMGPGFRAHIDSSQYVKAFNYVRAIKWGFMVFGRHSFIVLESSPTNNPQPAYYVLRLDEEVLASHWKAPKPYMSFRGSEMYQSRLYAQIDWFTDDNGRGYILRSIITTDDWYNLPGSGYVDRQGRVRFSSQISEEHHRQIREWNDNASAIPANVAAPLLFGQVDQLIREDKIQEASNLLAELDSNAFAVLPLSKRASYLDVLVRAWTFHDQEQAAIEIVKTASTEDDLRALIGKIQLAGRMEQFLRDMSDVWSLFVAIGKSIQPPPQIDINATLMDIFRTEVFTRRVQIPGLPLDIVRVTTDPETGELTFDLAFIQELEEACMAFLNFLGQSWDAIVMIFTKPLEILDAIGQLVKLIVMVELATDRHVPIPEDTRREAREYVAAVWRGISETIVNGYKGMLILNRVVGENRIINQFQQRLKWALLWEILSWFVGIGEISAALKTLGVLGKVRAFARIIRVLQSPTKLARLERFALLLGRARNVEHLEVLRYVSHLPDQEMRRIATLLEGVPLEDLVGARRMQSIEALVAKHPHMQTHIEDIGGRLNAFRSLERKIQTLAGDLAAQLSDNAIEAFQLLNTHPNLNAQQLQRLIDAIPSAQVEPFMRAVLKLQDANILRNAGLDFLTNFAHHPRIATFMIDQGDDLSLFVRLMQRSGEDLRVMEHQIDALRQLEARTARNGGDWNAFLQRLRANDAAAWNELLESRRVNSALGNLTVTQAHLALIEDAAYDLMRATTPAQRNAAQQTLRQRLTNAGISPARADQIITRTMNYSIVQELDLATHIANLNPAQRLIIESIDADGWQAIISKARGQMGYFGRDPVAATSNIAGTLREEITYLTRDFAESLSRARQKAATLRAQGVELGEVRLMRSEGGQRFGRTTATPGFPGEPSQRSTAGVSELTDNFIGAVDQHGNLHVLQVVESKSMSNVNDLFPNVAGDKPGQLLNDFERLENTSITVGGRVFDQGQIRIGGNSTEWFAAIPPDVNYPTDAVARLRAIRPEGTFDLRIVRHPMDNATIQNVMRRIMDVVSLH